MTTEEIIIRHAEKADAASVRELYSQSHIIDGTGDLPYPPLALWDRRSDEWGNSLISLIAEINNLVVGQLNISVNKSVHRKHVAGIGLVVHASYLNQGVGTKLMNAGIELADSWLNIKRLELSVYSRNEAAIHLYKKFGFESEGIMKSYAFRKGKFVDAIRMARVN